MLDILDYIDRATAPGADISAIKSEITTLTFRDAVYRAAVTQNFRDPEAVVTLLKDKQLVGVPAEDLVRDLAITSSYLVRPDETPAPSKPRYRWSDLFGPTGSAALANKIAKEDMAEYQRLRAGAVAAGVLSRR